MRVNKISFKCPQRIWELLLRLTNCSSKYIFSLKSSKDVFGYYTKYFTSHASKNVLQTLKVKYLKIINTKLFVSTEKSQKNNTFKTYPHVWSLVDGPKSEYIPSLSASHIVRSLFPRYGREQSLSRRPMTSAPKIKHPWG